MQRRAGGRGGRAGAAGVTDGPLVPFSDPMVPWHAPAQRLSLWERVAPVTHRLDEGVCLAPEPAQPAPSSSIPRTSPSPSTLYLSQRFPQDISRVLSWYLLLERH